jgi:hypothetical protein
MPIIHENISRMKKKFYKIYLNEIIYNTLKLETWNKVNLRLCCKVVRQTIINQLDMCSKWQIS